MTPTQPDSRDADATSAARGLSVTLKHRDDCLVVEVIGELSAKTIIDYDTQLSSVVAAHKHIIVDMSALTHISGGGLRLLLNVHRRVTLDDGQFALAALPAHVHDLMHITGFFSSFVVLPTVDDAIALFAKPQRLK